MKRLLIIISLLVPMTIAAQDATFRDMRRDTSTRGVDFSVKLIGSPGGDVNLVGGSDYIRGALGGEMTLGYRVNKAFTAGLILSMRGTKRTMAPDLPRSLLI